MVHLDNRRDRQDRFERALRITKRRVNRRWWMRRRVRQLEQWNQSVAPSFSLRPPEIELTTGWAGEHEDEEIERAAELARHNRVRPPTVLYMTWT
jgi:hypothetical protein